MSDPLAGAGVLVTRTAPDGERTAARLAACGARPIVAPVLSVRPRSFAPGSADGAQAVLVTSANGAGRLSGLALDRAAPVLAVGDRTADAARRAGVRQVTSAGGNVEDLAALAIATLQPRAGPLLYVRGAHVAGDLPAVLTRAGFTVREAIAYETVAADGLPPAARDALSAGAADAVLFHSARGAEVFARLVVAAGLTHACHGLAAAAMSAGALAPADSLPLGARRGASRPDEDALFDALRDALAART